MARAFRQEDVIRPFKDPKGGETPDALGLRFRENSVQAVFPKSLLTQENEHVISAEDEMRELDASSKLNASTDFLSHLKEIGRKAAGVWLMQNWQTIGERSSVDIRLSGAPFRYNCPHPEVAFGTPRESFGRQGSIRLYGYLARAAKLRHLLPTGKFVC